MHASSRARRAAATLSRWLLVAAATLVLPGAVPITGGPVLAPIIDAVVAARMVPGRDLPVILVARGDLAQLEGEISRARGEIEAGAVRRGNRLASGRPPPRMVHTEGHEPVHQVVAPGDAGKHLADEARLARPLAQFDAHSMRPPSTAAKRMTAI